MAIITVKNLKKEFKTYEKGQGILESIKSLFKRKYKITKAVDGISFSIKKGEIVGFIGPNGAGKSTTIKALTGILTPTSGEAEVLGYIPWKHREKYVKHIEAIFGQKSQLWWDLPAIDTFYLLKEIYEIPKQDFEKRLNYFVKIFKIKDIYKRPVRNLSLGERMKCEFIASMLHNPKIVFLDEPTIGLDVIAKETIRRTIKRINRDYKTTFILTTHDMGDIEELCKRIIIIDHGKIIYDGPIRKIKQKFIKQKIVEIDFHEKFKDLTLPQGCTIKSKNNFKAVIEVDLEKSSVSELISYLLNNFNVKDLRIKEQKIEEIIKNIYRYGI